MTMEIENVSLLIDTAIPCGMVVCELLSNSLEHAFSDDGTVEISLLRVQDGRYRLRIADDGRGPGADFDVHRDGAIGLQVVVAIVKTQLGGEFEVGTRHGTEWRITFTDSMYSERVPRE